MARISHLSFALQVRHLACFIFNDTHPPVVRLVSVFFPWVGFIFCYAIAESHAGKNGSLVGLGITIALQAPVMQEMDHSDFLRSSPGLAHALAVALAIGGYVIVIYGLIEYQRVREIAKRRHDGQE